MHKNEEARMKAKEARAAWNRENMKTVGASLKCADYEQFAELAARRGKTPGALIREYVQQEIGGGSVREAAQPYDLEHPRISDKVGKRLAEFTAYVPYNPDQLASMVLSQWMDNQLALYAARWGLESDSEKYRRMAGKR